MILELVTHREIDDRDLDIWLKLYRDTGSRFDIEKIKLEKIATWSDVSPETRSKATTTLMIVDRKQ